MTIRKLAFLCALAGARTLWGQTFTSLLAFDGTNGGQPGPLVQGLNGALYGTTEHGGSGGNSGTIFEINLKGQLKTLTDFYIAGSDAAYPGGLMIYPNGNFYGISSLSVPGGGAIFKVTPTGTATQVAAFNPSAPSSLVEGFNELLYGTTSGGGTSTTCVGGCGTVFEMTPAGVVTTLANFDFTEGEYPGGLFQATNGLLYGVAGNGGAFSYGSIFEIGLSGTLNTLYSFNGEYVNGLMQAAGGNFFGTTSNGGTYGYGSIFRYTPPATVTTLASFNSATTGSNPTGLIQGTDGNFYGATLGGGANGYGTIFQMTPTGTLTNLHSFDFSDGAYPGGLVQATNGDFYGAASQGGNYDCLEPFSCGTIFELSMGLGPFVKLLPTFGEVGEAMVIQGTDLTGATSVTFNGISAVFTVLSATAIKATVPTGATTGKVEVVTPGGTLTANTRFEVF
jgi:uncharacterized repeat protein (TIGR03803 family)